MFFNKVKIAILLLIISGIVGIPQINYAVQNTLNDSLYQKSAVHSVMQSDTTVQSAGQKSLLFTYNKSNPLNFGWMIVKTTGYFVLIVLLIIVLVFIMKKLVYGRKNTAGGARTIRVLSSTFVGPKKSLILVEAAGRILIIAVTDTQMNLIAELPKEEYEKHIQETGVQKSPQPAGGNQFGTVLDKILKWQK